MNYYVIRQDIDIDCIWRSIKIEGVEDFKRLADGSRTVINNCKTYRECKGKSEKILGKLKYIGTKLGARNRETRIFAAK